MRLYLATVNTPYDESGRALLLMEDLVPAGGALSPIWRLLVNALF